jgi:hydrophobe/amphiphile efflux-3 (HAE3) family protein
MFARVVGAAGRRPGRVLAITAVMAVLGGVLALGLSPSAATDTLVGRSSDSFQATERYHDRFGDDSVVVLVRGTLPNIVLTQNLGRLLGLEGCISGNLPKGVSPVGGAKSPCGYFAREKPVQVVYGPGTFINAAVGEIQDQFGRQLQATQKRARAAETAARKVARGQGRSKAEQDRYAAAARQLVEAQFTRDLLNYAVKYGLNARSANFQINNPDLVYSLVFDPARGADVPKARFAYLFPNSKSAVVQVRLKPGLPEAERGRAISAIREAVAMKNWQPVNGVSYTVTGAPVVVNDVTDVLSSSLLRLLIGGLVVMALALLLVFRSRLRLLPLAIALAAAGVVFGLMALFGFSLTMASIAVLPVLLGLGVDYAIQYQARVEEEGVERAVRSALPTIATACLATVVGFAVLLLSPVPMVRGFGLLLIVGIAVAFVLALWTGTAALARFGDRPEGMFGPALRGAGEILSALVRPLAFVGRFVARLASGVTRLGLRRPGRVLAVGFVLALAGWVVDSQTEVVSDIRQLVPSDLAAVRDLGVLQESTGVAGEIDVLVEGADLTDPEVVKWMRDYQSGLLKKFKYSGAKNGCGKAELCPALSLPDLFRTEAAVADQATIRGLLDAVPAYFSQAVITADRKTATLTFGIKLMSLERQQEVIDAMRASLDPPKGVRAELAGLPVLGAEANAKLSSPWRRLGTLFVGLLAVGLALLAVYRSRERAWVPLVPIALATGWSALVLFFLGVPLNPMSATLGALVIAISTEFAVLLTARFREERARGYGVEEALARTYASTGAAVRASGVTAIAGFAVLAFSDVNMLSDFGRVTVVDLTVSLLGVLAVLPAVLTLAERRRLRAAEVGPVEPREPALV